MNRHAVVSIASTDYLPMCLAMMESVARHHPEAELICCVFDCDAPPGAVPLSPGEGPDVRMVQLVGRKAFETPGLAQARAYFDLFELACASKFAALRYVLDTGRYEGVVYLDCDFFCFAPFGDVFLQLREKAMLVTPHCLGPLPWGQGSTDEYDLLSVGWMNAGMLAASKEALTSGMLDWLESRVLHYGFNWPGIGLFVDQSWVSALPLVFPESTGLIMDPGMNVGHWNAADRQLNTDGGVLQAGQSLLKLFHFSGFDRAIPDQLTRFTHRPLPEGSMPALKVALQRYEAARARQDERSMPCGDPVPFHPKPLKKRVSQFDKTLGPPALCVRMWQDLARQEAEEKRREAEEKCREAEEKCREAEARLAGYAALPGWLRWLVDRYQSPRLPAGPG